jgi:membrane protein implicated in regulation of membrane protease activity
VSSAAWLALAAVALVVELTTLAFAAACVALGAAAAAAAAAAGAPSILQATVFGVTTLVSLVATRRIIQRRLQSPFTRRETGLNDVIGRRGLVITEVHELGSGLVRVGSELWRAAPYTGVERVIPPGATVDVLDLRGLTVLVCPADEDDQREVGRAPVLDA